MKCKHPNLMAPLQIGAFTLKNRIEACPMATSNLTPQAYFTPENIAVFEDRAKGGAAIVNMGECRIDLKTGISHELCLALDDPGVLPSLIAATDAVKRYDAIPAVELVHPGGRTNPEYYDGTIWAPSDAPGHLGKPYTALDEETINYIVECFGNAAEMAMLGGVEMITVHAGHGWLLHEFLSPKNNRRTDKFGGSLENRARISLMVIDDIRKKCGDRVLLEFRISGTEYVEGGLKLEDQIEFAKLLDGKVDIINVSTGSFHFPEFNDTMVPSMFLPHGCNAYLAAAIKKELKYTKVSAVGSLGDPDLMEQLVAEGQVDLIGMVRSLIADPELPNKIRTGRAEDITPCQRCNACISESFVPYVKYPSRVIRCTANPTFFRETMVHNLKPAAEKKKVLVIGGGPAGLQAAVTLADRGHEVILCEKEAELGGAIRFAKHVAFKQNLDKLMRVLIRRVEQRDIRVMLNTEATPELAKSLGVDSVICAIGAEPRLPEIPGVDGENVMLAVGMHDRMDQIGDTVVIVGGGILGCEEAIYLAQQGKKVTLVGRKPELCRDAPFLHHQALLTEMDKLGVTALAGVACEEINAQGVVITVDGEKRCLPADTVILATGSKARTEEAEAFRDCAVDFRRIGDCKRPRKVYDAIHEGYDAGAFLS